MPRFVRPFFLDVFVEGLKSRIKTGPRKSNGQILGTLTQRHNKGIVDVVTFECRESGGLLHTHIHIHNGQGWVPVATVTTSPNDASVHKVDLYGGASVRSVA